MKYLHALYFLILLSLLPAVAWSEEVKISEEDLPSAVSTALANNPQLKVSDARWQIFRSKIAQASSYDDPMLTLKIQNGVVTDPFNFGKEPMTAKVVGISQQIPFWGKLGLKGELATKTAESYRWVVDERRLELTSMVKEAWYRLYYLDKSTVIVDRNIRILDDFISLAETRYTVSRGSQTDILKAQVGRSKLLDMRITLEQQRRTAQANFNALLYRPAETRVGTIPDFDLTPLSLSEKELREMAYEHRPMIKSLTEQISMGEVELKLADKDFYPDFKVSLEYMQRDPVMGGEGNDMYSLGLTFNLPVQMSRRHAAVAESNSNITMATEELNNLKNKINFGISDLLGQLDRRRKLVELYKNGIIPQADQTLESSTINYRVDKVDFLTLLDSQLTLFNYERELYESMADYQMKLAQLEALVGKELH
ncbi:MAG: TolC family protein [Proteobacteria bacterium]|nr:TolC family protein [Pseudomonadota bacterium]